MEEETELVSCYVKNLPLHRLPLLSLLPLAQVPSTRHITPFLDTV
jgi:hypothetical protein